MLGDSGSHGSNSNVIQTWKIDCHQSPNQACDLATTTQDSLSSECGALLEHITANQLMLAQYRNYSRLTNTIFDF